MYEKAPSLRKTMKKKFNRLIQGLKGRRQAKNSNPRNKTSSLIEFMCKKVHAESRKKW
jgi:hypothetical protein